MSNQREAAGKPQKKKRSWTYVVIAIVAALIGGAVLMIDPNSFDAKPPTNNAEIPRPPIDDLPAAAARSLSLAFNSTVVAPDDAKAWGQLGMTYYAHELNPQAIVCFEQAAQLDPNEPQWPYLHGMILAESDTSLGLPSIERAVELKPDDVSMRSRLAEFFFALDRLDESRAEFEKALTTRPNHPRILLGLARLKFADKDWAGCRELAEQASQQGPPRPDILELLSQACFRLGDKDAAAKYASQLESMHSTGGPWPDKYLTDVMELRSDPDMLLEEAQQMAAAGHPQEELRLLNRLVQVSPENPDAYIRIARALLRAGDAQTAAKFIDQGVERHPNNAELLMMQAVTTLQLGNTAQAIERLNGVLKKKPDYAEAYFILGNAYAQMDNKDEAIRAFENVLRYEPLFAPAQDALKKLKAP